MFNLISTATEAPILSLITLVLVVICIWSLRLPAIALILLASSLVIGQIIRVPLPGQGGGLLVSDIAAAAVVAAALVAIIVRWPAAKLSLVQIISSRVVCYMLLFSPFIIWSLFTVVANVWRYDSVQLVIVLLYWLRLTLNLALVPALLVLLLSAPRVKLLQRLFVFCISIVAILGLAQLLFLPTMAQILRLPFLAGLSGWDPHQTRVVSTWLDPNFLGLFFGIGIFWLVATVVDYWRQKKQTPFKLLAALFVTAAAFVLTQSRSSLLAVSLTALLFSFFLWLKIKGRLSPRTLLRVSATAGIVLVLGVWAVMVLGERASGLITVDETVQARINGLQLAWQLAANNSIIGVGYNGYQFAAIEQGLIGDFSIHSRAGADNSILTLWATTGLVGVVLYLLPWLAIIFISIVRWLQQGAVYSLAAAASVVAWLIHSQFVNSLLYSHLLMTVVVVVVLSMTISLYDHGR